MNILLRKHTWASRENIGKVAGVINEYKKTAVVIHRAGAVTSEG
jgi:hypothetical protein